MNFSPISQSMAENKCGRLNVKRSKFNKRSLSAPSFTLEISQRIHYDEFSSEQRFSSFQFYAPSSRINWICQSSPSPRFVPQFSPSFFSSKSTERIDLPERRRPKDRRELNSMGVGLDDGDREMIIGIDTPGVIFDIKSGCEDMQAESGCIIWPVAKGDQLLPVRCTFDLSLRDHFAWLTTPSR